MNAIWSKRGLSACYCPDYLSSNDSESEEDSATYSHFPTLHIKLS